MSDDLLYEESKRLLEARKERLDDLEEELAKLKDKKQIDETGKEYIEQEISEPPQAVNATSTAEEPFVENK